MATLCRTCHTENSETANFCNNCATALRGPDALSITRPLSDGATLAYESRTWDLPTGSTFGGRYQIIDQLGRGGMGRVYRALDVKTREEVAIKLIRPDIAEDKRTLERFVNEIKLAHKISHRNIGKMYHLSEDQGLHYITMEYVPGEDLKSFIRRSRRLDIATTVAIAKQVCSGLSEAHEAGIVHRDLKPGNIMIDKEGNAKILDFGIARAVGTQGVTAEGSVIGTPEYMSPEQVEGKDSDRRSDIYSFGVIMFEMVTGRLPFAADTPFVVAFKQQSERPTPPEDLNPQTPPQLSAIILRCLEKDPDKRFQTTEDVCRDLSQVEETIHTTPLPSPWVRATTRKTTVLRAAAQRFPWRKALVPVLAFLGIMAAGVFVRQMLPKAKGAVHTVAIVGFENLTGEAAYEYLKKAIPNLLITSLEQSKYHGRRFVGTAERPGRSPGPGRDHRRGPGLLVRGLPAHRRRRHRARELHQGREPVRHRRQDLRRPDQEPPQEHGLARRGGREHPQDADRRAQPRDRQGRGRFGAGGGQATP